MTKAKPKSEHKKPSGRPRQDLDPAIIPQTRKLLMLGMTQAQIALFFGVSEPTIVDWRNKFPAFAEVLKNDKAKVDGEIVHSLYERARGIMVRKQVPIKLKRVTYHPSGKKASEEEWVEVVTVDEPIPPDTTAMIFWLKNRQRDQWRDKVDHALGLTNSQGNDLSDEERVNLLSLFLARAQKERGMKLIDLEPEPPSRKVEV